MSLGERWVSSDLALPESRREEAGSGPQVAWLKLSADFREISGS
jgi:hypothetical protein